MMERCFLVVLLILMLSSGLMACSDADAGNKAVLPPPVSSEPTAGMPTLIAPEDRATPSDEKQADFMYEYVSIEESMVGIPQTAIGYAGNGVFLTGDDEVMHRQGSHYDAWVLQGDKLRKLEEFSFCKDVSVLGENIHLEFDWAEYDGTYHVTYTPAESGYRWSRSLPDYNVLMQFECWTGEDKTVRTNYPMLLNLKTGELTDILAGTGAEKLSRIFSTWLSEDGEKILLSEYRMKGGSYEVDQFHYIDRVTGQLYPVDELSGEHADGCSFAGDKLACWVVEDTGYRVWNIDLKTLERTEIIRENLWLTFLEGFRQGDDRVGGIFALKVERGTGVYALDLATGEWGLIEGLDWNTTYNLDLSPDGKKLLIWDFGDLKQKNGYVGILNAEEKTYTDFALAETTGSVFWFDNERIISRYDPAGQGSIYHIYPPVG